MSDMTAQQNLRDARYYNQAQSGGLGTQYTPEELAQFRDEQMKREREYRALEMRRLMVEQLLRNCPQARAEDIIDSAKTLVAYVIGPDPAP